MVTVLFNCRSFMVVNNNGRMISGRQARKLVTLSAIVENNILVIKTPHEETITVDLIKEVNDSYKISTR